MSLKHFKALIINKINAGFFFLQIFLSFCSPCTMLLFYTTGAQAATDAADSAKQGLGRVPAWCQLCRAWCHGERRSLHEE